VPFAALRKLLLDLGFVEKAIDASGPDDVPRLVFGHRESGCVFRFHLYRPQERVANYDLAGVRWHLDWRGLLSGEAFDAALREASA
jgi:hypothetical protein